jgi:hypothetical protein
MKKVNNTNFQFVIPSGVEGFNLTYCISTPLDVTNKIN